MFQSIQRLKPRYCNRRGRRPRPRQVVVERKLPLLPNVKSETGRQIVQMNIISQGVVPRPIAPKVIKVEQTDTVLVQNYNLISTSNNEQQLEVASGDCNVKTEAVASTSKMDNNGSCGQIETTDNAVTPSRVGSPVSISNLLDMALNPVIKDDKKGVTSFVGKCLY